MLSTFELDDEYRSFIGYLIEETIEEKLWELWIHKDIEESFEDFKKKSMKKGKPKSKTLSKEEEDKIMRKAENILNMTIEESA